MGCITLLSDFGLQDASVAAAKGLLMQQAPGVDIVDISHEVIPFNMPQAAYLLASAWRKFPAGTFHLALFDLYSETVPKLVLVQYEGHYFLSPDNGLLPLALPAQDGDAHICFELTAALSFNDWLTAAGKTIQSIHQKGSNSITSLPCRLRKKASAMAKLEGPAIQCEVVHVDHYENVVLNVTREFFDELRQDRRFRINLMRVEEVTEISKHYNDVKDGYKLCRFNSQGYLEICINRGKAASLLGLRPGGKHNDIKIIFE